MSVAEARRQQLTGVTDRMQVGVVLVGHGSRGDNANDGMLEVARALQQEGMYSVEVAFLQRNFPTIEEAARSCILRGAKTVLLIPYFLHLGLHLQMDLPDKLRLLRALHPDVRFAFGKPFAHHPKLVDIVLDRIRDCLEVAASEGAAQEEEIEEDIKPAPTNRPLRTGYTTGACAAAAAKAATQVLLTQKRVMQVEIPLPSGQRVTFPVGRCEIRPDRARCSVVKDAGDDPDVTDRAEICAAVSWTDGDSVVVEGGEGVGVVTKPGLGLPVGAAAINPVPRRMIVTAVNEALGPAACGRGARVVITVPGGEAIARRTLNQRLGIVGGISILGTTGIVVPFSASAYRASIARALDVAVAAGCREVVLTTGRRTERFAQMLMKLPDEAFIQVGDHIGFALEECAGRPVKRATLCLMAGKLSKLAAGQLHTHVSSSLVDHSVLARVAAECGADFQTIEAIRSANTAREFAEIAQAAGLARLFDRLCEIAAENCCSHVGRKLAVGCLMVDYEGKLLGRGSANE